MTLMDSHKLSGEPSCSRCGMKLDGATNVSGQGAPDDGDYSFCIYCGNWSIFEGGMLRPPTSGEAMAIAADPKLLSVEYAWRALRS